MYLILLLLSISVLIAFIFIQILRLLSLWFPQFQSAFVGNEDNWLLFSGSVLGGSITLIGITITLNHSDRIREDDKALSVMPICILSTPLPLKNPHSIQTLISLKILNATKNLMKDVSIIKCDAVFYKSEDYEQVYKMYSAKEKDILKISNIIKPNEEINFQSNCIEIENLEISEYVNSMLINAEIAYTDIFSLKSYIVCYTAKFILRTDESRTFKDIKNNVFKGKDFIFVSESNSYKESTL